MFNKIRPLVFWPSFLILMAAVIMSFVDLDGFLRVTKSLNATILDRFSWFFSLGSFYLLMLIVVVYFSPLGQGQNWWRRCVTAFLQDKVVFYHPLHNACRWCFVLDHGRTHLSSEFATHIMGPGAGFC